MGRLTRFFAAVAFAGQIAYNNIEEEITMQTQSPIFDEIAKLMSDAAGAADGVRREAESAMRAQLQRLLSDMELVAREEFEAVREMAINAREENERLSARIAELEAQLGKTS